MNNPHIIVGEPRKCLCGVYNGRPIGCQELIEVLDKIEEGDALDVLSREEAMMLNDVLRTCIKECD